MKKPIILILYIVLALSSNAQAPFVYTGFNLSPAGDSSNPISFTECNGKLFFLATTKTEGQELWVSDGTQTGTHMVMDINPGSASSDIGTLMSYNGNIYFGANDGVNNYLWVSDGTSSGTQVFMNITHSYTIPGNIYAIINGKMIFTANDNTNGTELWITDGTTAGTQMLKDISPGSSSPANLTVYNGKVYFDAKDASGDELWVTDGTNSGTYLLRDINTTISNSSTPGYYLVCGSLLYFRATDGIHGYELWYTDGTTGGTQMVKDIALGTKNALVRNLTVYNNKLYFTAADTFSGFDVNAELWVTDGTQSGTNQVKDIFPGIKGTFGQQLFVYKKYLYISTLQADNDMRLFRSDGTSAGTVLTAPTGSTNVNPIPRNFFMFDSTLFFSAVFNSNGNELWTLKDTTTYHTEPTAIITIQNNFSIFPNPNKGSFTLQLDNMNFIAGSVMVFDITGKEVYAHTISKQSQTIQLSGAKGVYFVKVRLDDAVLTKRIMVE